MNPRWLRFRKHRDLRKRVLESFRLKDTITLVESEGYSKDGGPKDSLDQDTDPDFLKKPENLGRLVVTTAQLKGQVGDENQADPDGDGLVNELFAFGARSFSIWSTDGQLVFDSDDDFEKITAAAIPGFFNTEDNNNAFDSRSEKRGPEPEALAVGKIGPRQYAFVILEQIGGIMVYDITNPYHPRFQVYINNRNFLTEPPLSSDDDVCPDDTRFEDLPSPVCAEAGDLGPEGVMFIPRSKSPIDAPLLAVTQEVSDTTTLYRIDRVKPGHK
jgi:hypothetical protein